MIFDIGISPCPNDTFAFEALYSHKINTEPYKFNFHFKDIQVLNDWALEEKYPILKISYAHYFKVAEAYQMLRCGSALGFGVGPLLISKKKFKTNEVENLRVAIPGNGTTAYFLLHYAFPNAKNTIPILFSDIEQAILDDHVDAGVIIHENRFTYSEKGLHCLLDLGEYWEQKEKLPIPLGGIAIKRDMDSMLKNQISLYIKQSIEHAFKTKSYFSDFIRSHAQEMDAQVIKQHIELYVNDYTLDVSEKGELAVEKMRTLLLPDFRQPIFV